jgi:hypothetical protein
MPTQISAGVTVPVLDDKSEPRTDEKGEPTKSSAQVAGFLSRGATKKPAPDGEAGAA